MIADADIAVLWAAVTLYAILGGADFGGGLWDLLAGGTARGRRPRDLIDHAIGPVWEANHVWLIFFVVVLFTAFPLAFGAITSELFDPLMLAVFAIVFRGAGFAFRKTLRQLPLEALTGGVFAFSSLAAPFFLGTAVGAVVTGHVPAAGTGNRLSSWTGATPLLIGALCVGICAWLAASYLTVDARRAGQEDLRSYFSRRARAAGVLTGLVAVATLAKLHSGAPRIFTRLTTGPGLPLLVISGAAAAIAFVLLRLGVTRAVRPFAAGAVTALIWGWGVAQYPYLLPGSLTVRAGSAPEASLVSILVVFGIVAVLVGPGFLLLFSLRAAEKLSEEDERDVTAADLPELVAADRAVARAGILGLFPERFDRPAPERAAPEPPGAGKIAVAIVAFLAGVGVSRRGRTAPRGRRRR